MNHPFHAHLLHFRKGVGGIRCDPVTIAVDISMAAKNSWLEHLYIIYIIIQQI
jgi:hypothetical protein